MHIHERTSDDQLGKHNTVTVALHAILRYKSWRRASLAARSLWELHIPLSHKYIYSLQIPHRAATSNTHPPLLRWKMSECIVVRADLHRADNIPQQMHWRERSLVIDSNVQYAGLAPRCSRVPDDGLCAERGENSNLRLC